MVREISDNLTEQQKRAVFHSGSPLLIIAGPGSGKTEVMARRIAHLVNSGNVPAEAILGLTFTNKATQALEDRIQLYRDPKVPGFVRVSTFHSFCSWILRSFPNPDRPGSDAQILDENAQFLFVYAYRKELGLSEIVKGLERTFYENVIGVFNRATEEQVIPARLEERIANDLCKCHPDETEIWQERKTIAEAYSRYLHLLASKHVIDFANLQTEAYHLLCDNDEALQKIQAQYCEILVDEFQDTNITQSMILKKLARDGNHLTVVGDDDQSIYRFRGATVKNILTFPSEYPDTTTIRLEENFRSFERIVDDSQKVIEHNPARFAKNLFTHKTAGNDNLLVYEPTAAAEAEQVVELLKQLLDCRKIVQYSDIAVLLRSVKSYSDAYVQAFAKASIPYAVQGNATLFKTETISQAYDLLHFLGAVKPWGDRYVTSPLVGLQAETITKLIEYKESLLQLDSPKKMAVLQISNMQDRSRLLALIELKKKVQSGAYSSILETFYRLLSICECVQRFETAHDYAPLFNLGIFSQLIATWDHMATTSNFYAFEDYFRLVREGGVDPYLPEQSNAVKIMTIHQSKGLEFPVVVLGAAMNGRLPGKERKGILELPEDLCASQKPEVENPHLVDERKLFYVATTRAKELLIVGTSDLVAKRGGGPSPFVHEMFGEDLHAAAHFSLEKLNQIQKQESRHRERSRYSFSQLNTYLDCPYRYKLAEVYGFPPPEQQPVYFGAKIHRLLQIIHQNALEKRFLTPTDLPELIDQYWTDGQKQSDAEKTTYRQDALTRLQAYLRDAQDSLPRTEQAELSFSFPFENALIACKIDLVQQTPEEQREIVDFKTSPHSAQEEERVKLQLGLYALGLEATSHQPVSLLTAYYLGKENKTLSWPWDEELKASVLHQIHPLLDHIEAEQFIPDLSFCKKCAEYSRFCPYSAERKPV
jgi:DNA helicase-2/ATP-dependent DNA helicase PcrA